MKKLYLDGLNFATYFTILGIELNPINAYNVTVILITPDTYVSSKSEMATIAGTDNSCLLHGNQRPIRCVITDLIPSTVYTVQITSCGNDPSMTNLCPITKTFMTNILGKIPHVLKLYANTVWVIAMRNKSIRLVKVAKLIGIWTGTRFARCQRGFKTG